MTQDDWEQIKHNILVVDEIKDPATIIERVRYYITKILINMDC